MKFPFKSVIFISIFIISCGKTENYIVNDKYQVDDRNSSRDQNERVSSLIFHYTALPFKESLETLTTKGVSAHWLVPENGKTVYKLVDENKRAYHAGISTWKKRSDINDTSVGVETVNLGFKCSDGSDNCNKEMRTWFPFPKEQQDLIVDLAKDIQKRYQIDPLCVVAHSDIAIRRKSDPGPYFPWKLLAENGVGAWVTIDEIQKEVQNIKNEMKGNISRIVVQSRLYEFGYEIKNSNVSDNFVISKLKEYGYDAKGTQFSDLSALNKLNEYGNSKSFINDIFEEEVTDEKIKKNITNLAIDAFLMHYQPDIYLKNETPDNLTLLATLQALLVKYPNRAKQGCGF